MDGSKEESKEDLNDAEVPSAAQKDVVRRKLTMLKSAAAGVAPSAPQPATSDPTKVTLHVVEPRTKEADSNSNEHSKHRLRAMISSGTPLEKFMSHLRRLDEDNLFLYGETDASSLDVLGSQPDTDSVSAMSTLLRVVRCCEEYVEEVGGASEPLNLTAADVQGTGGTSSQATTLPHRGAHETKEEDMVVEDTSIASDLRDTYIPEVDPSLLWDPPNYFDIIDSEYDRLLKDWDSLWGVHPYATFDHLPTGFAEIEALLQVLSGAGDAAPKTSDSDSHAIAVDSDALLSRLQWLLTRAMSHPAAVAVSCGPSMVLSQAYSHCCDSAPMANLDRQHPMNPLTAHCMMLCCQQQPKRMSKRHPY